MKISWFDLVAAADDPVDEKEPEKFAKVKPKGE